MCIQGSAVDLLNLLFLFFFLISLLLGPTNGYNRSSRNWISLVVSFCCALISIAYITAGLWDLIGKNGENLIAVLVYFIRALIWTTLTVSLHIKGSKWFQVLVSVWWVLFFLLVSALNTEVLLKNASIVILDAVTWPVNLLLFFCAVRNFSQFVSQDMAKEELSESLLAEDSQERHSKLGQASFPSKLVFFWVNPLLSLGYSKPLILEDIPYLVSEDQAIVANEKFAQAWDSLQRNKSSNDTRNLVFWAIVRNYWKGMVFVGICAFLRTASVVLSPLLLYAFVNYSNPDTECTTFDGILLVGCLVMCKLVESFSHRHFFFSSRRFGMRMRSALMVAVYQKQLKLSSLGRQRHSTGEVVNYIAVDAYRMGEFPMWFHVGWSSFVQLFLAIGVLFGVVGLGVLPGLVPVLICGLLNVPFAKILQKCQTELMIAQDKRLRSTSEILNNMKIIKLQSWEEKFKNLIESCRESEFKWLAASQYKKVYGTALYWMSPTIVSSVIFFGCAIFKSASFNAGNIFTILAALRTMSEPVRMIPEALSMLIQVKVSFDRINSFLLDDELKSIEIIRRPLLLGDTEVCTRIIKGNFSWDPDSSTPTLKDVNLEVKWGHKVAICGPVGAGKSSLLYAILGEISKTSGTVS